MTPKAVFRACSRCFSTREIHVEGGREVVYIGLIAVERVSFNPAIYRIRFDEERQLGVRSINYNGLDFAWWGEPPDDDMKCEFKLSFPTFR